MIAHDLCMLFRSAVVFIIYYDILHVVSILFLNTNVVYRRRIKFFTVQVDQR